MGTPELCSRRAMAGLLTLLAPAGRVSTRLRPLAPLLLGTATSCAPPLWALALSRPRPDARLLRTARGDCLRRQVRLPTATQTLIPKWPERRARANPDGQFLHCTCLKRVTSEVPEFSDP